MFVYPENATNIWHRQESKNVLWNPREKEYILK